MNFGHIFDLPVRIWPDKEVKNVLMEHPNVSDIAVVPMADELKGEVPVAFVVEK